MANLSWQTPANNTSSALLLSGTVTTATPGLVAVKVFLDSTCLACCCLVFSVIVPINHEQQTTLPQFILQYKCMRYWRHSILNSVPADHFEHSQVYIQSSHLPFTRKIGIYNWHPTSRGHLYVFPDDLVFWAPRTRRYTRHLFIQPKYPSQISRSNWIGQEGLPSI